MKNLETPRKTGRVGRYAIFLLILWFISPYPGSRGPFSQYLGWDKPCSWFQKISEKDLWSHKQATSIPCEKSVQNLNWVADCSLPCLQGISVATANLIGFIEGKMDNYFVWKSLTRYSNTCLAGWKFLFSTTLFHRLVQKMLQWVPFDIFLHFLLKFQPFDEIFPFQNVMLFANLSLCVLLVCVHTYVYIHWMKTSLKLSALALFFSAFFERW